MPSQAWTRPQFSGQASFHLAVVTSQLSSLSQLSHLLSYQGLQGTVVSEGKGSQILCTELARHRGGPAATQDPQTHQRGISSALCPLGTKKKTQRQGGGL